jgi:hypothetical protein
MIAIVLLAKDIPTITTQQSNTLNDTNPTIKQSQTTGYARLNIMPPTKNFAPQPF